ncbi:MAG TPA: hypothetical protein VL614_19055 [Acetobacteraceae bacterium]|jgi:hypothetical protein|nr:hypothetical protein [Acetobacteraceae bacterium]
MSGRLRPQPGNIFIGIVRVARGRADGMAQFGGTRESFLASLAPLIALPMVGGVLMILSGGGLEALADLLATLCALLAPPVLSFEVACRWGREAEWLRFATAFNWCQWIIPMLFAALLLVFGSLTMAGLPADIARNGVLLGLVAYGLWLHCFLARHGLRLSWPRAGLLVIGMNLATVLLVAGPRIVALATQGSGVPTK